MKNVNLMVLTILCATTLSGCGSGEKIVGTDAAKLLLAEERLDSKDLNQVNISFDYNKNVKKAKNEIQSHNKKRSNKTGVEVEKVGDTFTWSNFGEYCNSISYFEEFVESIEKETKNGANLIDEAKNKIDSNNVWVESWFTDRLLQVEEDVDVVMQKNSDHYLIVTRSLNEQGVQIYDIFNGAIGENYGKRVRKLGDYRYEYSYVTEDGKFEHYFIADCSRGYWVVQSPTNNTQFATMIIKDDRCYEFSTTIGSSSLGMIKVMTADKECDILTIMNGGFRFYAGAFSNLKSMSLNVPDDKIASLASDVPDGTILLYNKQNNQYSTTSNQPMILTLENGKTINPNDTFANGKVTYEGSSISGGVDGMTPSFFININGDTLEEKLINLELFLKESGLNFVRDQKTIIDSIKAAYKDASASLTSLSWNDMLLDTPESYLEARRIEKEKLPKFVERFNEVKDNLKLSRNQQGSLDRNTKFPYASKADFNASYASNIVTLNNAMLEVDNLTLFEIDEEYTMNFALAQYDEEKEGYFDLVPIEVDNPTLTTYKGEERFALSAANLKFTIPVPAEGKYELVSYITTDEGIRVMRPQPIKFENVVANEINIHNYKAQVSMSEEKFLTVSSTISKNVVLDIKEPKQTYTYDELYRLLSTEAFQYGVVESAKVEVLSSDNNWLALQGNEVSLASGTYRLPFTNEFGEMVYVSTMY